MDKPNAIAHQESMLVGWETDSRVLACGHFRAAKRDSFWNDLIGAVVIGATAVAGSTVFANTSGHSFIEQLVAGTITIMAAVLASEQKYLRLEERATKHLEAARGHRSLQEDIDLLLRRHQDGSLVTDADIDRIKRRRDEVEKTAPTVPGGIYARSQEAVLKCSECPRLGGTLPVAAGAGV